MIAYQSNAIQNFFIQQQAEDAFNDGMLHSTEWIAIKTSHPFNLFIPRLLLRIGFSVLTAIVMLFSFGLMMLFFRDTLNGSLAFICFIFSVGCFLLLEYFIRKKLHFRSGTDDVLLYGGALALLGALFDFFSMNDVQFFIAGTVVSIIGAIRYADRPMSVAACFFSAGTIFNLFFKYAYDYLPFVPWVLMAFFLMVFFYFKRSNILSYHPYFPLVTILKAAGLTGAYFVGNYYVVSEFYVNNGLELASGGIRFGYLYWIITIAFPLVYIYFGYRLKDLLLMRTGLLILILAVWIIRQYHLVMPIERFLSLFGSFLMIAGWFFINRLAKPGLKFTSVQQKPNSDLQQVEAVIIAETFSGNTSPSSANPLGGGSFGGGGSSGDY